jgi:hypothetical protein
MVVDKNIKPEGLFGKKQVVGDVLVVYELAPDDDYKMKEFHLLSINTTERKRKRGK